MTERRRSLRLFCLFFPKRDNIFANLFLKKIIIAGEAGLFCFFFKRNNKKLLKSMKLEAEGRSFWLFFSKRANIFVTFYEKVKCERSEPAFCFFFAKKEERKRKIRAKSEKGPAFWFFFKKNWWIGRRPRGEALGSKALALVLPADKTGGQEGAEGPYVRTREEKISFRGVICRAIFKNEQQIEKTTANSW